MGSISNLQFVCINFFLLINIFNVQSLVFDVVRYGARADGRTDSSNAIVSAWNQACQFKGENVILVPQGAYLLRGGVFKGPCKGKMVFTLQGILKAASDKSSLNIDHWISFQYVNNFVFNGGGSLDAQGPSAWPFNSCSKGTNCKQLPIALRFDFVTHGIVEHIRLIDSKSFHINIFKCEHMIFNNVNINAPANSPNTDGIHIGSSNEITIAYSTIRAGDDCISMGPGSKGITVTNVRCGPGHGISIGSLGKAANEEPVADIDIRNSIISGTENGVRIKTWSSNYQSLVSNVTFENINMVNVYNPIIIDQSYCTTGNCGNQESQSKVKIEDIKFTNIWGSSRTKVAASIECSRSFPCQKIRLNDINLQGVGGVGATTSSCSNANGVASGTQIPPSCV